MNRSSFMACALGLAVLTLAAVTQSRGQSGDPTPASGSHTGPTRVAVVDLVRIFNECQQIIDLNEQIKKKTDDYTKEAGERRRRIEDRQTALNAFKPGTPDYESRRTELVRANIDANVWLKVAEQEIEQDRFTWTIKVYETACAATTAIAREKGFDLILQRSTFKPEDIQEQSVQAVRRLIQDRVVVHHAPELDLTDVIINKMNADYRIDPARPKIGSSSGPSLGGGNGSGSNSGGGTENPPNP